MKKLFTLSAGILLSAASAFGQIGATAPDFTVTDLDGNSHNLYDILNSGRVVVLDCSATWCSPCWSFHNGHYLEDIHTTYGPNGTDQVRVLFYEADAATTLADLQGTGGNTMGVWLSGSSYPFINESHITLSGSVYWPLGFPTINVIAPEDKKIKADLYDPWVGGQGLAGMIDIIDDYFMTSADVEDLELATTAVVPNPSNGEFTVTLSSATAGDVTIEVVDLLGKVVATEVQTATEGENAIKMSLDELTIGQYILRVSNSSTIATTNIQINK